MGICMMGVDYNKASVDIRALFSFTKKYAGFALADLKADPDIYGAIILSTCNRTEIWANTREGCEGKLPGLVCKIKELQEEEYEPYITLRQGKEAVDHLFRLTSGLKSQIIAEDQIITQVKDALALAREHFATDNVLEVLFRNAVTAAKKVKSEVAFDRSDKTAVDKAIDMLKERGIKMEGLKCLVIGNGQMGKLTSQTLLDAGADVTVTVRQYTRGIVDIPMGAKRINYTDRMQLIPQCRVVFSATASPNYTLTLPIFEGASLQTDTVFIDLAVPRDIEPEIGNLPGVTLFDIDDFTSRAENGQMKDSIAAAEEILNEQENRFFEWYDGRDLIPRIQEIKEDAVTDLDLRIHKIIKNLPLKEQEQEQLKNSIDTAVGKVVTKMIFGLRDSLEKETFLACVEGLSKIYEEQ